MWWAMMIDQDLIDYIQEHDHKVSPEVVKELLHNYIQLIESDALLRKEVSKVKQVYMCNKS